MDTFDRKTLTPGATHARDHLANERTLLSWVRLGLSAAGLGFVVARFGLQSSDPSADWFTEWIGVLLLLLGPVIVTIAAWMYFQTERDIDANVCRPRYGLIWSIIGGSVLLGIALSLYLVLTTR
jgi:putative membrane protein